MDYEIAICEIFAGRDRQGFIVRAASMTACRMLFGRGAYHAG